MTLIADDVYQAVTEQGLPRAEPLSTDAGFATTTFEGSTKASIFAR